MKELQLHKKFMNIELAKYMSEAETRNAHPSTRTPQRVARAPQPATRNLQRGPRNAQRATRNMLFFGLTFIFLLIISPISTHATATEQEAFKETVHRLSALADRSTGTDGNRAAANYVKEKFEQLGFETIGTQKFSVPVILDEKSTLSIAGRDGSIPIRALRGNAVTPQTIPPPGIIAPLIYVGKGDLTDLNGKAIEGAIILMELGSGKNWLHVADLGAKALIYVDRGKSSRVLFEDKLELSPIQFPRFWISIDRLKNLFPGFEAKPAGRVAETVSLTSKASWKNIISENVYAIVPGTDPALKEQSVMVEAFYDSTVWVSGLSPGADEACSVATLLYLARYLKANPPQRTVLLIATSGHAQTLAGMRELMWSLTTRSKIQRQMKRELKALIKKSRTTIEALKKATFETADAEDTAAQERQALVKEALEERIKTVSDGISRRLIRLRMQSTAGENKDVIDQLAAERMLLRRLVWKPAYTDLLTDERQMLTLSLIHI